MNERTNVRSCSQPMQPVSCDCRHEQENVMFVVFFQAVPGHPTPGDCGGGGIGGRHASIKLQARKMCMLAFTTQRVVAAL